MVAIKDPIKVIPKRCLGSYKSNPQKGTTTEPLGSLGSKEDLA